MASFAAMNYFRRALRFTYRELCVQIHALSYSRYVKLVSEPYAPCAPIGILRTMPKKFNSPLHEAICASSQASRGSRPNPKYMSTLKILGLLRSRKRVLFNNVFNNKRTEDARLRNQQLNYSMLRRNSTKHSVF